jgi:hypothetical protein
MPPNCSCYASVIYFKFGLGTGEWAKITINEGITDGRGKEIVGMLWSWRRRRSDLRDVAHGDRRIGAGTGVPRRETLPGDQLAARTDRDDRCREPSVMSDWPSLIQPDTKEVRNHSLDWRSRLE